MNKSIKVNNQMVVKILETIEKDKSHYPELWKIISGRELEDRSDSIKDSKAKFIGNLDFLNLKKIENPKLLTELAERINRGEIRLNVFDCCYLMQCFGFIRKNIEEANAEKKKQPFSQIQIKDLDLLVMMTLHLLKKDNLLCPNHHKLIEEVEKKETKEIEAPKTEPKDKKTN